MQNHGKRLHGSIGVDGVPAFSHVLDLGWIDMLDLLHLLRNNEEFNVETGTFSQNVPLA